METIHHPFDLEQTLHKIKHYLPSQMTLKDFVHHNTLHAFQDLKFYTGIFRASKIFGYKVCLQLSHYRELFELGRIKRNVLQRVITEKMGKENLASWMHKTLLKKYDETITPRIGQLHGNWKRHYKFDMESRVQPLLFRILCSYLDQGIALWNFPAKKGGFLASIRYVESSSYSSFLRTSIAKKYLHDENIGIEFLLNQLVGDKIFYEQYLFDLSFNHPGWSGMVKVLENNPEALLIERTISLKDFIFMELLLEIDALVLEFGNKWLPLCKQSNPEPVDILANTAMTELDTVLQIWQDAFEWTYYDEVISGIQTNIAQSKQSQPQPAFQAIFCIDERECSIRRHLEAVVPACETYGAPGFFGVEFYFKPAGGKFMDKLCPAPVTPKHLIKEYDVTQHSRHDIMFSDYSHTLLKGFFATLILGVAAFGKLFQTIFKPKMSASISDSFSHMNKHGKLTVENHVSDMMEDGLQIGFTIDEMSMRVENFLRGIGLIENFSPIIYVVSHGSSSANNPHHGAHDCGACSGRPGCVNARVFAIMANHMEVRSKLRNKNIDIPENTIFVAAMHDTASDLIRYYDDEDLPAYQLDLHLQNKRLFENALDLNAKERSRRFASIDTKQEIRKIRKAIEARSVSLFEPRPELGHGTNSVAIVGRRKISRGLYLDRRAFLNSYDYSTDPDGTYLTRVLAPIGVVCGGINLEYYFSRVDNVKLGSGTKLPHNVMGLIGVANSSDGDLRPGLPWQMVEPHDPVRLLVIVEHYPEIVLKAIRSDQNILEWYQNEWVHIAALHPDSGNCYYFKNGAFILQPAGSVAIKTVKDIHPLLDRAPAMLTNHITHATFENLPVYQLQN